MALRAILDNLEGLAADVSKEYKKREDGKYVLDVVEVDGLQLANVTKLQSALSKERENAREGVEKLKTFDGLDPGKAREALKKVEDMATWSSDDKVKEQIEAIKQQMVEAHGQEKGALEAKLVTLTKCLEDAMIVSVATQALSKEKGSVALLMPHIQRQTRLRDADGTFVVEVVGDDGNPRLTGADAHRMTIDELVTHMKSQDDFANAFEGTGASGTGAGGSNGHRRGTPNYEELAKLPPAQRMQQAQKMGINK